jgi:glucokinase
VIGVLGPGTGLGVSGVIPTVDGFVTLGSEGGHTNFAPADEREYAILQYAWQTWSHVSTERLISGPGMEIIYRAIAKRNGRQVRDLTSQEIISGALTDKDPLCLEVLECFCAMLGGATANLAVTLGAFGGMFIGGGIVPRLGDGSPARRSARASKPRAVSPATWPRFRPMSSPRRIRRSTAWRRFCPSTCAAAAAPTR